MAVQRRNVYKKKTNFSPGTLAILILSVVSIGLLGVSLVIVIQSEREASQEAEEKSEPVREEQGDFMDRFAVPQATKIRPENPKPVATGPPVSSSMPTPAARIQKPKSSSGEYRTVERKVPKGGVPKKSVRLPKKQFEKRAALDPAKPQSQQTPGKIKPIQAGYTIQVASYRKKQTAEQLKTRLRAKKFDAYIFTTTVDQTTYYQVRVGAFDSIEKARIIAKRLRTQEKLNSTVTGYAP